jgi:hypothetical protein
MLAAPLLRCCSRSLLPPEAGCPRCSVQFREDCTWRPLHLAAAVLLWDWSDETTLGDRFFAARRIIAHLYRPQQEFAGSVPAFMKMLVKWTAPLLALVQGALQQRMQQVLVNAGWCTALPCSRPMAAARSCRARVRTKRLGGTLRR